MALVQGREAPIASNFTTGTKLLMWNPGGGSNDEYGASVSALPRYCMNTGNPGVYNDTVLVGSPGRASEAGAVYLYRCATPNVTMAESLVTPSLSNSHVHSQAGARHGAAVAGFRRRTDPNSYNYTYFAAVGAPGYTGSAPNPKSGIVYLYQYNRATDARTQVSSYRPGTRSDNDEFGRSLAVQQVTLTSSNPDLRYETYIGIGMPGTQVNGIVAGKVYVWRPWNFDGSLHNNAHVINAPNPSASTDTRFGASVAALRDLSPHGGFVGGAPGSLRPDGTKAGSIRVTLDNTMWGWDWTSWTWTLDEETEGDRRPTN